MAYFFRGKIRQKIYLNKNFSDGFTLTFYSFNDHRLVVKDHVKELKWHSCPPKWRILWLKLINRKDLTKITDNTRVGSNHFVLGRPYGQHPHPTLYMRGYSDSEKISENIDIQHIINSWSINKENDDDYIETRQGGIKRKIPVVDTPNKRNNSSIHRDEMPLTDTQALDDLNESAVFSNILESEKVTNIQKEHQYARLTEQVSSVCTCTSECGYCKQQLLKLEQENLTLQNKVKELEMALEELKNTTTRTTATSYDINKISHSDDLILLHTGLKSYSLFTWILNLVKPKLPHMQYYRGANSRNVKSYQVKKTLRPGPKRLLKPENKLLVVLMKLKVNLSEQFLAHLFDTCTSLISQVLSTWLPLLAAELRPLLYWPKQEELPLYYPDCFKKYNNVRAIIDCTEVPIQRPSLAKANSQIYSSYKGRPTAKVLVACTPAGTISFVSKAAGGSMSDKDLVKRSGIVDLFSPGDTLLADRGFNIQELLLHKGVKLVIPPFLKAKKQFSNTDDQRTKQVANARIHVERVIGRIKDFDIMKAELPLEMFDIFDHIVTVTAALVNLQPPIVPLQCR